MLIESHEKNLPFATKNDMRTVIIHAQFINKSQLNKISKLNIIPSFFTNHAYFWGDAHLKNLGEDRANFLSPIASADELGITYTNHTDYLITPLDPMFVIWTAVNRETRNGITLGEHEKATPYQALKAITINAAYQYYEEDMKGSIDKGKLADFVILSDNPLTVDAKKIKDIKILETIKNGESIFNIKI
jgi:predicted amidohydrolase YtcJ